MAKFIAYWLAACGLSSGTILVANALQQESLLPMIVLIGTANLLYVVGLWLADAR
jgi:hypothetical protein